MTRQVMDSSLDEEALGYTGCKDASGFFVTALRNTPSLFF